MEEILIHDVSDTALWVAVYRGEESERPDALFRDPYAFRLAGDRGRKIASKMKSAKYTSWTLSIRTVIIDNYIQQLIEDGLQTVINLGAGLDARPYRLSLPTSLRWIEADFPHMIEHKEKLLAKEKPTCRLERFSVDLGNAEARRKFLSSIVATSGKTLVLTEGVIPYLTVEQVAELADDLRANGFAYWITEYLSKEVMKFIRKRRWKQMQNAPFVFDPPDWFGFFAQHGWEVKESRYLADESQRLGRAIPMPWWAHILQWLPLPKKDGYRRFSAYILLTPK